jgi:hypothetical protein
MLRLRQLKLFLACKTFTFALWLKDPAYSAHSFFAGFLRVNSSRSYRQCAFKGRLSPKEHRHRVEGKKEGDYHEEVARREAHAFSRLERIPASLRLWNWSEEYGRIFSQGVRGFAGQYHIVRQGTASPVLRTPRMEDVAIIPEHV